VFFSLYFQAFWLKWLHFFLVISKTFRSMTETSRYIYTYITLVPLSNDATKFDCSIWYLPYLEFLCLMSCHFFADCFSKAQHLVWSCFLSSCCWECRKHIIYKYCHWNFLISSKEKTCLVKRCKHFCVATVIVCCRLSNKSVVFYTGLNI